MRSSTLLLALLVGCSGGTATPEPPVLPDLTVDSATLTLDPCADGGAVVIELPAAYAGETVTMSVGSFLEDLTVGTGGRIETNLGFTPAEHPCGPDFASAAFDWPADGCFALPLSLSHAGGEVTADLSLDPSTSTRVAYTADDDGDGFAAHGAVERWACQPLALFHPTDQLEVGADCDDADAHTFPGAVELCSGLDENCDGLLDEGAFGYRIASSALGSSGPLVLDTLLDDDVVEVCSEVVLEGTLTTTNVVLRSAAVDAQIVGRAEVATGAELTVELPWSGATDEEGAFATVRGDLRVVGDPLTLARLECPVGTRQPRGGAFVVDGGKLALVNVEVEGCEADEGGAIHASDANVELLGTSFRMNRSGGDGGALYQLGGTLTIRDSTLQASAAVLNGGAIWASDVDGVLSNVTLYNNDALIDGGALWLSGRDDMHLEDCTLDGNIAGAAGGAAVLEGEVSVFGGTFSGNAAETRGGALYYTAVGTIDGSSSPLTFSGNFAPLGGALVLAKGDLTGPITFDDNSADRGGALVIESVSAVPLNIVLPDLSFTNNRATQNGGAVSIASTATLASVDVQRATFTGNSALNGGGWHQAIAAELTFDAQASDNLATRSGGVLFANTAPSITLTGTFTGNEADQGAVLAAATGGVDLFSDGLVLTGNEALTGAVLETGGEVALTGLDAWSNQGTGIVLATPGTAALACTDCTFVGPNGELTLTAVEFADAASTTGVGSWDVTCLVGLPCVYAATP